MKTQIKKSLFLLKIFLVFLKIICNYSENFLNLALFENVFQKNLQILAEI